MKLVQRFIVQVSPPRRIEIHKVSARLQHIAPARQRFFGHRNVGKHVTADHHVKRLRREGQVVYRAHHKGKLQAHSVRILARFLKHALGKINTTHRVATRSQRERHGARTAAGIQNERIVHTARLKGFLHQIAPFMDIPIKAERLGARVPVVARCFAHIICSGRRAFRCRQREQGRCFIQFIFPIKVHGCTGVFHNVNIAETRLHKSTNIPGRAANGRKRQRIVIRLVIRAHRHEFARFCIMATFVFAHFPSLGLVIELQMPVGIEHQQLTARPEHTTPLRKSSLRVRKRPGNVARNDKIECVIGEIELVGIHVEQQRINTRRKKILARVIQHLRRLIHAHHAGTLLSQHAREESRAAADIQNSHSRKFLQVATSKLRNKGYPLLRTTVGKFAVYVQIVIGGTRLPRKDLTISYRCNSRHIEPFRILHSFYSCETRKVYYTNFIRNTRKRNVCVTMPEAKFIVVKLPHLLSTNASSGVTQKAPPMQHRWGPQESFSNLFEAKCCQTTPAAPTANGEARGKRRRV